MKQLRMYQTKLYLWAFLWLLSIPLSAQTIQGTVTDDKNEPLVGASVVIQGTSKGTLTDINGGYKLDLTDAEKSGMLVFSFVGYETQNISINNQSIINISLQTGNSLTEVVVTALGIKKEAKKLGYSTTTVGKEQLTENRSPNFINALSGKIAV